MASRPAEEFRLVEANLRESFRVLLRGRATGELLNLDGIGIISLGVAFQMFNAAFISGPVKGAAELGQRLELARRHFAAAGRDWSFWVCEDWLDRPARRQLTRLCRSFGLRVASEVPGMIAEQLDPPRRQLPALRIRRVEHQQSLDDFTCIGAVCFNLPSQWYEEVFDASLPQRPFIAWVAYENGCPVATAASVTADGVIGIYNVATAPGFRGRGIAEAITRHALTAALLESAGAPIVLQSSPMGVDLYYSLGFRAVTRILVYNS